ncbi:TraM recognition domain-containing protein [Hamadaea sp. NPDC051192]|uniref:type IV secretory system conjugative DNA transfer family protein n=1 Tax=Hamadaea sp. NPDC051192 TaxID=3154940 RepID=UPI00344811EA
MQTEVTTARTGALDGPAEYAIVAGLGLAAMATIGTWLTGQISGLLFRLTWPRASFSDSFAVALRLPVNWRDPRQAWPEAARNDLPGTFGIYVAALLVLALIITMVVVVARRLARSRQLRGFASRQQLEATLSRRAVFARTPRLRPSLTGQPQIEDIAVSLGRAVPSRIELAATVDNSVLLLAAPRQGKTSQVIIPWLKDWPGPALVTSVRPDVLHNTLTLRRERGPIAIMDLSGDIGACRLRWSPLDGCREFDKARERADIMVTVGKTDHSDSTNAGFFGLTATNLLAGWLHIAAVTDRTLDDVLRWALNETDDEPVKLLAAANGAHPHVGPMLETIYNSPTETRSNMWATVLTGLGPLLTKSAHDTFCPAAGECFDIEGFLRSNGTIYLMVSEKQAAQLAPLISAFVDEITIIAKRLADVSDGERLDPPLGLFLDEVANVVPLPSLPALMSYAGGSGIFIIAVLQNLAQARQRWGRERAEMLWGAATVKIALGGLTGDELEDLSRLAGEYRETVTTPQRGPSGTSFNTHVVDRKTISSDAVRTLSEAKREALIIHATTPAVKTRMIRHYEGPDAKAYAGAVEQARHLLREGR